ISADEQRGDPRGELIRAAGGDVRGPAPINLNDRQWLRTSWFAHPAVTRNINENGNPIGGENRLQHDAAELVERAVSGKVCDHDRGRAVKDTRSQADYYECEI